MTDRRAFIRGLAGAAVLSPVADHAQAPSKTRRVGVLMTTTPVAAAHIVAAFADGLKELGHVEGQTVVIEYRWATLPVESPSQYELVINLETAKALGLPSHGRGWSAPTS